MGGGRKWVSLQGIWGVLCVWLGWALGGIWVSWGGGYGCYVGGG